MYKTIAWEQRRLGDIANTFKGGGTPKTSVKEYWDGTLPWIQSSDLLKDKLFENWEQRRLGDIANTFKGGGTPKTSVKEYWDGTLPWIQSSDLLKDKLFENIPNKFITEEGLKNSATKLIEANSIAIVTRVGVGKVSFFPYDYATSQDFISFSNLNVDLKNSATKLIEANSIAIVTRVGVGKVSFFPYDYATSQDFISFSNLNVDPKFGTYLCYRTLNHIKLLV